MSEIVVTLASEEIDIHSLLKVEVYERSTSFPYATETQPHTAQITLSDPTGRFGPDNANNFFSTNMQNQNGARCPVKIEADTHVLFSGEVDDLKQNIPRATVLLKCIDNSREIRIEALSNFGLQKAWKLIEDTDPDFSTENGVYPIGLGVAPLSEDSISASRALNQSLNIVPEIKVAGVLDADNIAITDTAVVSEGGPIAAAAGSAYPQITAKSLYRYKKAITLINAILAHYAITDKYIDIPNKTIDPHAETVGRPGYESVVGNIGSSNHLSWYGYVTDILADGDVLYFAYTVNRGSSYDSRILTYDRSTDAWETLYTHATAGTEIWGLEKIGDDLIMLLTDSANISNTSDIPATGSYDSNASSKVYLAYFDATLDTPSVGTLVAKTATYPPQLAHFYQIGAKTALTAEASPLWETTALPDTRRRLLIHNNQIYYGWAKNGTAGVAKVAIGGTPASVMDFASDSKNHAGFGYCFNGSQLILATTFFDGVQSTLKAVRDS